jgi:hypothetical protein
VHFESRLKQIPEKLAARKLYHEFVRKIVPARLLLTYKDALIEDSRYIIKIKREMGLQPITVRKFRLGLDPDTRRITIPIFDQFGHCINVRYYRLPSERLRADEVKIHNLKGYGHLDIYPISTFAINAPKRPLLFMASEKEALLAIQDGFDAFTTTTGEGSWDTSYNDLVRGRRIFSIFDRDKGGVAGAQRIQRLLADVASYVGSITLPFSSENPRIKDYADWRIHDGGSAKRLNRIILKRDRSANGTNGHTPLALHGSKIRAATAISRPVLPEWADREGVVCDIVRISSTPEYREQRITVQGIVAAKSALTYSIPWKFEITPKHGPIFIHEVEIGRDLLRFTKASDDSVDFIIKKRLNDFTLVEVKPLEFIPATEVEIIPTAAADRDVPYVTQRCFFLGDRIESNVPYEMTVIPTAEIRTQEAIGIITEIKPLARTIDKFNLTPEIMADLMVFKPEGGMDVWQHLAATANEIAENYTKIHNRLDWHIAALLTWCCPIGWKFPGESELQRGWFNTLALGDTETGKSKVSKALKGLFNAGVFINSENCTYVGLVGGAIKMGSGQFMLRWGRIPLGDKQLVILEELSGLSVTEISNMSEVRSSGYARLDKGGINAETNARTRLLCLSNVRSQRRGGLSSYLSGVLAIQELVGHGEDIARFDLITTLIDREVSIATINTPPPSVNATATEIMPDMLQKLCHFIWALTPEQIHFTQAGYEACLSFTKELAAIYHPSIPIFKGGSGRYKLGRIAAAIACFQFHWDDKRGRISVEAKHVAAAAKLLRTIYDKPSFGYLAYSKQCYASERIGDPKTLRKAFLGAITSQNLAKVLSTLVHSTQFSRDELQAIAGISNYHADRLTGAMVREGVVTKGIANVWNITPAGKRFMEKLRQRYE